ncbi:hypothetical protein BH18GEM1_BH18GEM1_14410 [soil metagenome]
MTPVTLRFHSDALEKSFLHDYRESSRRLARRTMLVVALLFTGFSVLDRFMAPVDAETFLWIRLAGSVLALSVFAATFLPGFTRVQDGLLALVSLAVTAGILAMIAISEAPIGQVYYVGFIIVIMGTHSLFRLRVPLAVALNLGVIIAYNLEVLLGREIGWHLLLNNNAFLFTASILGTFASYSIERYARINFLSRLQIEEERARSENLLLNILPPSIAERLKADEGTIADRHAETSVLFADISGFTGLSARLSAEEIVGLLNGVFIEFDQIAREHGVEKIKTIGDAYMVVGGLPVSQPDHLERIARAALAMLDRLGAGSGGHLGTLTMRMGIATGPVVAGVIGRTKFSYDLWGDTVNIASAWRPRGCRDASR